MNVLWPFRTQLGTQLLCCFLPTLGWRAEMPWIPSKHAAKLGIPVLELIGEEKAKKKKEIQNREKKKCTKTLKSKKPQPPKIWNQENMVDTPQWQPVKRFRVCQLADPNAAALCDSITPGNNICAKQYMVSPDYARPPAWSLTFHHKHPSVINWQLKCIFTSK